MRHQLMQMQVAEGILTKQTESLVRISFAPVFLPDENAYLCMGMQRLVIEQVHRADRRMAPTQGNDQPELLVRKKVATGILQVLTDRKA